MTSGAPGGSRTPDLLVRSQTLYPAELRARCEMQSSIRAKVPPMSEAAKLNSTPRGARRSTQALSLNFKLQNDSVQSWMPTLTVYGAGGPDATTRRLPFCISLAA